MSKRSVAGPLPLSELTEQIFKYSIRVHNGMSRRSDIRISDQLGIALCNGVAKKNFVTQ